jgi:hypothetical protein
MSTLLADSPPAPPAEQVGANGSAANGSEGREPAPAGAAPASPAGSCAKCGAPMAPEQDWCLQCGAGAPGSLGTPSWRPAAAILGATAILALGAAAAAYAALSKKGSGTAHVLAATVARTTTSPTTTPPAVPGGVATTPAPSTTATTTSTAPGVGLGAVKPPKIPLTAITPKVPSTTPTTTSGSSGSGSATSTSPTSTSTGGASTGSEESTPTAILLDTDAASTYNPYGYPASEFGDPSLAIDGDSSTGWTAQVDAAAAPRMAEGLLIDLKAKQKLSAVQLITSTPGMTVQVYGANGASAPSSITDPEWVALSRSEVAKKKHLRIKLRDSNRAFTFVTLWISKAPESSTPQTPGHVSVNELELFPSA